MNVRGKRLCNFIRQALFEQARGFVWDDIE